MMESDFQPTVLKFGGASLKDLQRIEKSCDIIYNRYCSCPYLVVVVSAMGQTTDMLLKQAFAISAEPSKRELDMLLSAGERISMALVAMALKKRGIEALSFTGSQTGIVTTEQHSDAEIVDVRPFRIVPHLEKKKVVIVAGFQGVSREKEITTLGRGGSDTTAVALGVALKANWVEFYKDVDGVFDVDPKQNENAHLFTDLTYFEALEIIQKSSKKLLHPRALVLAQKNGLPLFVCSFLKDHLQQNRLGSWIRDKHSNRTLNPFFELENKADVGVIQTV